MGSVESNKIVADTNIPNIFITLRTRLPLLFVLVGFAKSSQLATNLPLIMGKTKNKRWFYCVLSLFSNTF